MKSRAWVQRAPRTIHLEEFDLPDRIDPDEAVVRVDGSGLCGTDYEQYVGTLGAGVVDLPVIPGHEPVVVIERIGEAAMSRWGLDVGARVAVAAHAGCGVCADCSSGEQSLCVSPAKIRYGFEKLGKQRDLRGGMAEHMVLGGNTLLIPVPDTLSTEDALLFNPLGAGFAWAIDRGRVGVGDSVLVVGAGQRGLACAAASAVAGAGRVVVAGIVGDEFKLDLARRLGATETVVIDPSNAESLIDQVGADAFDCVVDVAPRATQPIIDAVAAVRRGGRVVLAGLKGRPVPGLWSDAIVLKGITVAGARSVDRQSFVLAMSALERGLVRADEWHTHRYELDELETALLVQGGEKRTTKVPLHVTILSDDAVR
jgi:threonine dehydrogenase-like Zn-dependent dehydrogenase